MDKQSAINLIKETFENPFEKERYVKFVKNLFNKISLEPFEYYGQYIPDTFKQYINKYERVGKYVSEDKRIDILIVFLNKETSIERARTMQRNFVAGYLTGKYGSDTEKDAAIVAFVSPGLDDWRFSLVKMEYKLTQTKTGRPKGEEEFTPARRYSFLVGKNEPNHTAQQQLLPLLQDDINNPTLEQLEKAFSVEKVTKEFLNKYRDLYIKLKDSIDKIVIKDEDVREDFEKKKINTTDFSKKLLGQIVFLYFLQKKGWLGVPKDKNWGDGDRNFLRSLFTKCSQQKKNFFNDYLEILFYNTLNDPRLNQADATYSKYFDCRIPFLNGGLFEPINNYDWKRTDIIIPNELFSNNKKTEEGDIGSGILDVFDRYNFTVQEDEPLEKEVALDPELLGKVFENLIEENLRKGQGTYYTPREIVHYMCQESLINYLATELEGKVNKEDIELFIKHGEHIVENEKTALQKEEDIKSGKQKSTTIKSKMPESIRNNAKLIDDKLANIRVCDSAVGSGAFPVGMMLEIVKARNVLTNYIVTQPFWLSIYFAPDEPVSKKNRNLPHWEQEGKAYFVTFRLYDSIPKDVAENIRMERENWFKENKIESISDLHNLNKEKQIEYYRLFSKRYDELLDNGHGSCILKDAKCRQIVEDALNYFNNDRYYLDKYVIMPNHVHVIVIPKGKWSLSQIMHSWKSYTANQINKLTGREGELWMHESFDHIIRNPEQLERIRKYIEDNPKVISNDKHKQDACDTVTQPSWLRERTTYNFKRHCIEKSLYGVDIDSGAVEICKLRFWLSLIVDEEDFYKIQPLPNLDYKVTCGNSLLSYPYTPRGLEEIENLKEKFFNEARQLEKNSLKKQIDEKIFNILKNTEKSLGYKVTFDFKIHFSEVFRHNNGFDVVIANPPYIQLQKNEGQLADLYDGKGYETFDRMGDIYCLFYEKGLQLLKPNGYLCFITSNKWMRAGYGEKLRTFFLKYNPIILIDLGPGIFESATVDTNILLIQKAKNKNKLLAVTLQKENNNIEISKQLTERGVILNKLKQDAWFIGSSAEQCLKEKIEQIGKPLKDWDVKIYRGVLTGLNEAFIITSKSSKRYC